jgi:hypothetical protein
VDHPATEVDQVMQLSDQIAILTAANTTARGLMGLATEIARLVR